MSRHGHAFIDRALYLPKGWTDDPARLKATSVPDNVSFSTKPQLAVEMIERALAAGVRRVVADSVYGVGDIERNLRQPVKAMYSASIPKGGLQVSQRIILSDAMMEIFLNIAKEVARMSKYRLNKVSGSLAIDL